MQPVIDPSEIKFGHTVPTDFKIKFKLLSFTYKVACNPSVFENY